MFIYNVTVSIDPELEQDWLTWMQQIHIPEVLQTGCFMQNKILKVITDVDSGATYSIQYFYELESDIETYRNNFAPDLQRKHLEKFKDKFVAFRTILKEI